MQLTQTHIIRRQNVKVQATAHDAFALKRKIELLMEDMVPRLSSMFDGLIAENEWLQIDTLNINVDDITEDELDDHLLQRILQGIRDEIDARRHNLNRVGDDGRPGDFEVVSVHQKTIAALFYFLRHGILPWWFETASHDVFETQLAAAFGVFMAESQSPKTSKLSADLRLILQDKTAQKRLLQQFGYQTYLQVISLLVNDFGANAYTEIDTVTKKLTAALKANIEAKNAAGDPENYQNASTLISSLLKNTLVDSIVKSNNTAAALKMHLSGVYQTLKHYSLQKASKVIFEDTVLKKYLPEQLKDDLQRIDPANGSSAVDAGKPGEVTEQIAKETSQVETPPKLEREELKKELERTRGAIIFNAGLVAVAPFLPELLNQCGLVKDNKITDVNTAIAVLHYTVFGNCDYKEYDVLLNKILCGVDENLGIEIIEKLPEAIADEVDTMLSTAIGYWSALKGTSPDGLREGFLRRKGSLLASDGDWFLQVEQSAIDALLQQLPWTIGFIKLPWMNTMLKTQWI